MNTEGSQEILQHLLQQGKDFLETIQQFIAGRKDILTFTLGVGCVPLGIRFFWWWAQQNRKRQKPLNTFPFEVIKPQSNVLRAMFTGEEHDPLADYRIPYQERVSGRSIHDELKQKLDEYRWVLILAPTGMGKTREAANLAQRLNAEGWTVLKLKRGEWLEKPLSFPEDKIGTDRKLLFILDNLNDKMRGGETEYSPRMDDPLQSMHQPLQERLLETLEFYEKQCGKSEIRVLATARNEGEREHADEPSPWEKLKFEKYRFWKRFKAYRLDAPDEQAIVNLLKDTVPKTNIQANADDYFPIAQRNDRTFSNIIQNLRSVREDRQPLALNTFRDTLQGTWQDRYQKAIEKYPVARYIYDAVELLRELGVSLDRLTVIPTAQLIAGGKFWQRLWLRRRISIALNDLTKTGILEPRDGQIQAKGEKIEVAPYISALTNLLLKLSDRYSQMTLESLIIFGVRASNRYQHLEEALALINRFLSFVTDLDSVWFLRGNVLAVLGRYEEAIDSYDTALALKPDDQQTWFLRGNVLLMLERYEEAIDSYDTALVLKPDGYQVWHSRGIVLSASKRNEEAIGSYDKALTLKPDNHQAWCDRGIVLNYLGRYEEAIDSYDKALTLKPDNHQAWYCKGIALFASGNYQAAIDSYDRAIKSKTDNPEVWYVKGAALATLGRNKEAIASYDKAIECKPNFYRAWGGRGMLLLASEQYQEALDSYNKLLEIKPDENLAYYNKARCYGLQGNVEQAVEALEQSILINSKCRERAKTDAAFDAIREDDRFQSLIGGDGE